MKKLTAFLLGFVMLFSFAEAADISSAYKAAAEYIKKTASDPQVSSIGGEWAVIGIARSEAADDAYFEKYYNNAKKYIRECGGILSNNKYTEYSRVSLALSAIGKDPRNVEGYNLLSPLGDYKKTVRQGLNGAIWALIALDSKNYEIPENHGAEIRATREMYVEKILTCEGEEGGWSLFGEGDSEADITAMALCALRPYSSDERVKKAQERALEFLSAAQNENGGYICYGAENSESCAQVITALCALGISETDSRFIKNGKTLSDNLLSFYNGDGSFSHIKGGGANQMATEQAFYALAALKRFNLGKSFLYDLTDEKKEDKALTAAEKLKYFSRVMRIFGGINYDKNKGLPLYFVPMPREMSEIK